MGLEFNVEIKNIDHVVQQLLKAPMTVKKHANEAIQKSVFTLLANARLKAPIDRGFLRGVSMVTTFADLKGALSNRAPYARYVEEGTGPHYVPIKAIERWADSHGVNPYALQKSIARKGTKARPFFKDSIEASQDDIDSFFRDAGYKITEDLSK